MRQRNVEKHTLYIMQEWQYVNEIHEFIPKITTRKVVQLSKDGGKLIKIWDSVKGAAEYLGGNSSSISNVCSGRENSYKGFKWMYYEDWLKLQQKVAQYNLLNYMERFIKGRIIIKK